MKPVPRLVEGCARQRALKLDLLHEATRLGIADIEGGRYRTFATPQALSDHLRSLSVQAIQHAGD